MKQPDENNGSNSASSSNKPENNDHIVSDSEYLKSILRFLPSGYRFNPLDQELILDYLVPKLKGHKLPRNLMHEVDFYEHDPEYLSANYEAQGPKTWYFFTLMDTFTTHRNRNLKNGNGCWRVTGQNKPIKNDNDEAIGLRRNLCFVRGGDVKNEWLMHEFEAQGHIKTNLLENVLYKLYKTDDGKAGNSKREEKGKRSPDKEEEINLKSDGSVDLNANGNDNDNVNGNEEGSGNRPMLPDLNN